MPPAMRACCFLFDPDFDSKDGVAFWMKNTLISLDMLFVRDDGTIYEIHPRAKPEDLTPIIPSGPARAVIEINGGEAESLNIKVGDKVVYPGFAGAVTNISGMLKQWLPMAVNSVIGEVIGA